MSATMPGLTHGAVSTYRKGCRCEQCVYVNRRRFIDSTSTDALTGGQWVPRDGIMRWQPDLTTTTSTRQEA